MFLLNFLVNFENPENWKGCTEETVGKQLLGQRQTQLSVVGGRPVTGDALCEGFSIRFNAIHLQMEKNRETFSRSLSKTLTSLLRGNCFSSWFRTWLMLLPSESICPDFDCVLSHFLEGNLSLETKYISLCVTSKQQLPCNWTTRIPCISHNLTHKYWPLCCHLPPLFTT